MLERFVVKLGVDGVYALHVAANVAAHVLFDDIRHVVAGLGVAVGQHDRIPFGLKSGQIIGTVGFQRSQIPRRQIIAQPFGQTG